MTSAIAFQTASTKQNVVVNKSANTEEKKELFETIDLFPPIQIPKNKMK